MSEEKSTSNGAAEALEAVLAAEAEGMPVAAPIPAPSIESLERQLLEAEAKANQYLNELLRARAEIDNVVKRSAREVGNAQKYALERFVADLLPVKDSLDLGRAAVDPSADLNALREGLDLTLKMWETVLERHGVKALVPTGTRFNPELHQAMTVQESRDSEPGTVLSVVQKGYLLNDRLLRPAMVIVSKPPPADPA